MNTRPISTARAVWLICKLGLRRKLNRISHAMRRRRKRAADGQRTATPRKRRMGMWFACIVLPFSVLWGAMIWTNLLANTLPRLQTTPPDVIRVSEGFHRLLDWGYKVDSGIFVGYSEGDWLNYRAPDDDAWDAPRLTPRDHRAAYASKLAERLRMPPETIRDRDRAPTQEERDRFTRLFIEHGPAAVEPAPGPLELAGLLTTPPGRKLLALAVSLAMLVMVTSTLGTAIRPDHGGDAEFEWLFSLPLPARTISLAEILRDALVDHWALVLIFPLMAMWFAAQGLRLLILPATVLSTAALAVMASCVVNPFRTVLYQRLSPPHRANLRGLLHLTGVLLFLLIIAASYSGLGIDLIVRLVGHCPQWITRLPWTLAFSASGATLGLSVLALLIVGGAGVWFGACLSGHLLRDGLACPMGKRPQRRARAIKQSGFLPGMVAKELKLLVRDRGYFLQTLVVPLAVAVLQLMINPAIARGAGSNIQHTAALAYGTACYAVLFGTTRLLTTEARSLWMLHTFPQRIDRLLRQKAFLLAGIAGLLTLGISAVFTRRLAAAPLELIWTLSLATVGAGIFAMIAAGIGVRMADPFEANPQRSVSGPTMYMLMIVASLFVTCFYAPSPWTQIVVLTVFVLAAVAIWQNVAHSAPYLMDPTQQPPPQLQLSDALLSVFVFFTLMVSILLASTASGLRMTTAVTFAYALSGVVVAAASMLILRRRKIPHLWRTLGIATSAGAGNIKRIALGLGLGIASVVFAAGYMSLIEHIPVLREWRDKAPTLFDSVTADPSQFVLIAVLVAVAAPLVEEYLFRGLLLRSLQRSMRPGWAIVLSAAMFAAVHPAISFPAVFLMGLLAAWAAVRTGSLLPGIVAHAVHNGAIVAGMAAMQGQ